MGCNNNNNNNSNRANIKIKHVFGNVLQLAIPLTLRILENVDDEIQATDEDFIPSSDYPVTVEFKKDAIKVNVTAEMRDGNLAYIEDNGTIPIGIYDITVLCKDDNGRPYRFKQKTVLQVVDATADAGITTPIEFETQVWYLDAAIFLALKGDKGDKGDDGADGVGISNISVAESDESHGANIITIYLDNGTRRTFRVLNGIYDDDYNHTDNNYTDEERAIVLGVGTRFANIQQLVYMFASSAVRTIVYNPTLKKLVGYPVYDGEGEGNTLFDIDVSAFVRDTHVESAYLNNGIITIEFDTESGKTPININLSDYINPNDYYTKTEADERYAKESEVRGFVTLNAAGKINYATMPFVVLSSMNLAYNGNANSSLVNNAYYCTDGYIRYFYRGKDNRINSIFSMPISGVLYLYNQTGDIYIWDASNRVFVLANNNVNLSQYYTKAQIDAMGVNGIVGLSYDWANYCLSVNKGGGNIESVFVPSLIILAATTSGNTISFYGFSHNYGQPVSYREAADLMTSYRVNVALLIDDRIYHLVNVDSDSDSTYKYAHLDENLILRTISITFGSSVTFEGTTTDLTSMFDGGGSGGYEPPTGGIPKSDLSQEVQASLNKADTALQQHQDISGKVDKEQGKGLSTEDYTTAEKQKLAGLSSYDDSALQTAVTNLQTAIANVYTKAQTYSKTEVDDKVANAGKVKSVSINGTNHTPNSSGVVDLGTIQGEKGDAGTISIGSVSSGATASVTNSGTADAAVLDFVLPRGAKGEKGDKGDTGASGVHVGDTVIEQYTGSSTTSLMSQKAVTDAINYNVNIEHGTSVILPRIIRLYTQLTQSQIEALNSSEVVTMLFKVKAHDSDNGTHDWRYFEASPYTQTGFAFWTSFWGSIRLRSLGQNDSTVGLEKAAGITSTALTPHPNICALVCDRVHGWVRFYRGKDLIVEDVQEYYKKSKFIDDDGLLCFCGGDYMAKLYAFQLYDFNAMPDLIKYDKNFLTVNGACDIPIEMDASYGESRAWMDVNHTLTNNYTALNITENNGVYTYTRKDGNAGDIYITGYSSQSFVTTKVDFTVDTDWSLITYGNGWLEVYDKTTGTRLYTQTKGTIPAGSYIVYTFDRQGLFGLNTKSAGATVTVYEAKYRPSGIVANLRFDTLYNKNTFYDDVAGNFFQLFKDTQMTQLQSTFNLSNEQLNTIYSSGNLFVPHYVGEIKVVDGNIFIADATWTWKKINNT